MAAAKMTGKLANGELVTIKEIHEDGRIALADGRVLSPHFRQFVRGLRRHVLCLARQIGRSMCCSQIQR